MKRLISTLLILSMTVGALSACSSGAKKETESDTIKIGVFEPLTGANAAGGELETEGAKLANTLYPEVLGKKVELIIVDNKSDKAEAATAAARLLEKDKVVSIIGSWGSSNSMAAGPLVLEKKVPAVGASCTNPMVTLNNDYYFRVCFIDTYQGTVMANHAYKNMNAKTAAVILEASNDYSVGLGNYFKEAFVALAGSPDAIIDAGKYQTGDKDFSAILTTIKEKNPDVVFAPGNFTESALIIKQARQLGITTPFIGGDTWETDDFIKVGGAEVEGAAFSTFFAKEKAITPEAEKFLAEYAKAYPDKEPAAVTALAYDAYILILDCITKAGSADPQKIRDELAKTKDFQGVTGSITLDENGDAIKTAVIKSIKDGKFAFESVVDAQ